MKDLTLFPDHQIIQNILMEDINIPYSELKVKVDTPIKPIYYAIDKLIRNQFPFFPILNISNSSREPKRTRLRSTRAYWVYNNPMLTFRKKINFFIQLGDHRTSSQKTIFWGVSYWVGGVSDDTESVFHLFERLNKIKVFKEAAGVGGVADKGTTVFGIVDQYTTDQLINLQSDIKVEIAKGIGKLFQEIEQISGGIASEHNFHPVLYLPTKADVEFAESQLRKLSDEVIGMKDVLDQIEVNFNKTEKELKEEWREISRRNIEIWFGKNKEEDL